MSQKVDEARYEAMISALNTFAANVTTATDEMQSAASTCVQGLCDEDSAISNINEKLQESIAKYAAAVEEAKRIAGIMQAELEISLREREIWANDSAGDAGDVGD